MRRDWNGATRDDARTGILARTGLHCYFRELQLLNNRPMC